MKFNSGVDIQIMFTKGIVKIQLDFVILRNQHYIMSKVQSQNSNKILLLKVRIYYPTLVWVKGFLNAY